MKAAAKRASPPRQTFLPSRAVSYPQVSPASTNSPDKSRPSGRRAALGGGAPLFLQHLHANGIPEPVAEHRFSPPRRFRFDWAFLPQKVALEVDGGVFTGGRHTRAGGFLSDMEKLNLAVLQGWRVLRCTPSELLSTKLVHQLRAVLGLERHS